MLWCCSESVFCFGKINISSKLPRGATVRLRNRDQSYRRTHESALLYQYKSDHKHRVAVGYLEEKQC